MKAGSGLCHQCEVMGHAVKASAVKEGSALCSQSRVASSAWLAESSRELMDLGCRYFAGRSVRC